MALLQNLTIRDRIISALLLVGITGLIIAFSSLYLLNALGNRMSTLINTDAEKVKLSGKITADLLEIHRAQKNLIMATDKDQVVRNKSELSRHKANLASNRAALEMIAGPSKRELLRKFDVHYEVFQKVNNQIESMIDHDWEYFENPADPLYAGSRQNNKAVALSIGEGRIAYDAASAILREVLAMTQLAMDASSAESRRYSQIAPVILLGIAGLSIAIGILMGILVTRSIARGIDSLVSVTGAIAAGELENRIDVRSRNEIGLLASSIESMQAALLRAREAARERDWLKAGVARLNDVMRGKNQIVELCRNTLSELATYSGAEVGALFLMDGSGGEPVLKFAAGYAYARRGNIPDSYRPGEGLVGQAALEKRQIILNEVPRDYVKICSGLGDACPGCITLTPLIFDCEVTGVIELGFISAPGILQKSYLEQAAPVIAINMETVKGREDLARALAQSQVLYEELQQQQEELRAANEELEEQSDSLNRSQAKLRQQQEELEKLNRELEEKNYDLQSQKEAIEQTRDEIEEKAAKLAIANRYKSDFLANMSHELRTPLNSMLLLSRVLSRNEEGNLTDDQVRSAEIIHTSGNDLLSLINEILDLARIEAGRMDITIDAVPVAEVERALFDFFNPLAKEKGLGLLISSERDCPNIIWTDRKRVEQILRNLVSNALKFTQRGEVRITFGRPPRSPQYMTGDFLSVSVADTGVGIPPDKHDLVFEAFQQIEGGESRRYGGTGLGLSISRELAHLLGGEIRLASEEGAGATFTLILPVKAELTQAPAAGRLILPRYEPLEQSAPPTGSSPDVRSVDDDRDSIAGEDKTILIVEDDSNFAELLVKLCRKKGFKCLAAMSGEEGVRLAARYVPKGIILDLRLPGKDGWAVLGELKGKHETRHIPVHIMSIDDRSLDAFRKGAIGFLTKPAAEEEIFEALGRLEAIFDRQVKELLVVEDDRNLSESIRRLIGNGDVLITEAANAETAIEALRSRSFDCMILDLGLPDMNGLDMLRLLSDDPGVVIPPVIVYTGRELTHEEELELRRYSDSIIIKGVRSEERLFDEASLFLHRIVEGLPAKKRRIITDLYDSDAVFKDKRILIVDDDMRNVFALSAALEEKGIKTIKAENGKKALDILEKSPEIDLILMDIMMPVMDGYETMQRIRADEKYGKAPIIALTAKAMKQDRERCIASGANDYLPKPVDLDRLCSMLRIWLYR